MAIFNTYKLCIMVHSWHHSIWSTYANQFPTFLLCSISDPPGSSVHRLLSGFLCCWPISLELIAWQSERWMNEWMNEFVFAPSYRDLSRGCCVSIICLLIQFSFKSVNVRVRSWTVSGNEFQIERPEVAKLRDPYHASRLRGIARSWLAAERRCWRPHVDPSVSRDNFLRVLKTHLFSALDVV